MLTTGSRFAFFGADPITLAALNISAFAASSSFLGRELRGRPMLLHASLYSFGDRPLPGHSALSTRSLFL